MRVSFCVFFFGIATLLTGVRWSATPKTETFNATTKTRIYMYIIVRVLYDDVDIMCVIISTFKKKKYEAWHSENRVCVYVSDKEKKETSSKKLDRPQTKTGNRRRRKKKAILFEEFFLFFV